MCINLQTNVLFAIDEINYKLKYKVIIALYTYIYEDYETK